MNFSPPGICRNSGWATPALHRDKCPAIRYKPIPAERHLSFAGNCSDNRGQFYLTTICTVGDKVVIEGDAMVMPTSAKSRAAI
jgi:hypothetical protein